MLEVKVKTLLLAATSVAISACSAALVPESNDPAKKISQARELLSIQRGIPAERLLRESIDIYSARGDKGGMARAKQEYALLLVHPSYRLYEKFWRETGRYDPTNRTAIATLEASLDLFTQIDDPEGRRSAATQLGRLHAEEKDTTVACKYYDDSVIYHQHARQKYPDHNYYILPGTKSFEETIALLKSKVPCA